MLPELCEEDLKLIRFQLTDSIGEVIKITIIHGDKLYQIHLIRQAVQLGQSLFHILYRLYNFRVSPWGETESLASAQDFRP